MGDSRKQAGGSIAARLGKLVDSKTEVNFVEINRFKMATKGKVMGIGEPTKKATRTELLGLIKRQDYRCALTGLEITPEAAELDHMLPVTAGGTHSIDNLQVLHKTVNRMKAAMENGEFILWCQRIADHANREN